MSNCASSCSTKDHETFGECLRSQRQMVAYCNSAGGSDFTAQKRLDRDLANYKSARAEGIQPAQTTPAAVEAAFRASDASGTAFVA